MFEIGDRRVLIANGRKAAKNVRHCRIRTLLLDRYRQPLYTNPQNMPPLLPKGTILKITSWYDNTSANPNNPDPNQWVGFGDRTVDEMGHAWVNITYMSDEDYQAEVDKRKASQTKSAALQQ